MCIRDSLFSVPLPRQQVLFAVFGSDKRNLHDRIRLHVHAVQISDAPWTYVIRRILLRHADTVHGTKSRAADFSLLYRKTGSRSDCQFLGLSLHDLSLILSFKRYLYLQVLVSLITVPPVPARCNRPDSPPGSPVLHGSCAQHRNTPAAN